jgi:excisionase family DNA binding protein
MSTTASIPTSSPASRTGSIKEAARLSGRSDKTIRRWIKAGRLRAARTESGYRIDLDDLSTLSRTLSSPASTPELDSVLDRVDRSCPAGDVAGGGHHAGRGDGDLHPLAT